jgi:cysteine desulfurase
MRGTQKNIYEEAREDIASSIGASSKEIIFTRGASESKNLAIKGVQESCCCHLEKDSFDVTYLPMQTHEILT